MNYNKYILSCLVALFAASLINTPVFAHHPTSSRAYYVSLSGNDKNPGTKAAPFKTIDKVNGLHLVAGDTVYFKSGQTFNGSLLLTQGISGTLNKPVVITS